MRSSSPGSWDDLLWRLRAELAAARSGDTSALRALAAGATLIEPPPDAAAAAQALHLQARLLRQVRREADAVAHRIGLLRAAAPVERPSRLLDLRR